MELTTILEYGGFKVQIPTEYVGRSVPANRVHVSHNDNGEWRPLLRLQRFAFTVEASGSPTISLDFKEQP